MLPYTLAVATTVTSSIRSRCRRGGIKGVLSGLEVAFSRLGDQKLYVQNLMQQKSQDVWKLLSHPKCHYYVCGDAKMADDVFEVMLSIAKIEGGLSHPKPSGSSTR
jgi:sulfite reductase alpha subunit-like flavoprotein